MYLQRAAFVWMGGLLGVVACSTGPSTGASSSSTSTSTTSSSTTTGGGTGGTGGMDAGTCAPRGDYYDFCGDCRRCLEVICCAEIIACENEPGCIDCVSNNPDAGSLCGTDAQLNLNGCSGNCSACHSPIPNMGCFPDAGPG
jgi:hypothetical protein